MLEISMSVGRGLEEQALGELVRITIQNSRRITRYFVPRPAHPLNHEVKPPLAVHIIHRPSEFKYGSHITMDSRYAVVQDEDSGPEVNDLVAYTSVRKRAVGDNQGLGHLDSY
jgi:hypothetical protein